MLVKLMLAARLPRILAPLEHAEARGIGSQTQATLGSRRLVEAFCHSFRMALI
jgi:hypothetical protein